MLPAIFQKAKLPNHFSESGALKKEVGCFGPYEQHSVIKKRVPMPACVCVTKTVQTGRVLMTPLSIWGMGLDRKPTRAAPVDWPCPNW